MLQEPAPTEFDVRFRLFGIPVRVHPLFWVVTAVMAGRYGDLRVLLTWIGCVFVSILVHEFGHALTARSFGERPRISLFGMGGLAIYQPTRETFRRRFLVIATGPLAGLSLFALTLCVASIALGSTPLAVWRDEARPTSLQADLILQFLIQINLYWSLINLLPVMPLDGGQMATILLTVANPRQGERRGYLLSIATAILAAAVAYRYEENFLAIFMGILAFQSYQMLQTLKYQTRYGTLDDDADWWKK